MRNYTLLFICLAFSTLSMAQSFNYYYQDTVLNNTAVGDHIDFEGYAVNLTANQLDTRWDILNVNFPGQGWEFYVCDNNNCYASGIATRNQTIDAQDSGMVKVTLIAGNTGVGSVTARVTDNNNTSDFVEYNLTLDATTSTHRLASVVVFSQNAPNPFNDYTIVKYDLKGNEGEIIVFNIIGQPVANHQLRATSGQVEIGADLESGVYFYSLFVDGQVIATKRLQKL